jgi:hypothetical protein
VLRKLTVRNLGSKQRSVMGDNDSPLTGGVGVSHICGKPGQSESKDRRAKPSYRNVRDTNNR